MGELIFFVLGLLWLMIVIFAVVRTAQSQVRLLTKVIWIVVLIFFPVLGVIMWLLLGPGHGR